MCEEILFSKFWGYQKINKWTKKCHCSLIIKNFDTIFWWWLFSKTQNTSFGCYYFLNENNRMTTIFWNWETKLGIIISLDQMIKCSVNKYDDYVQWLHWLLKDAGFNFVHKYYFLRWETILGTINFGVNDHKRTYIQKLRINHWEKIMRTILMANFVSSYFLILCWLQRWWL